jgi:hypothetical protein
VPVRLKIDIGYGAVMGIGGHEDQAPVAGFPVRPLGGPGLRSPGSHLVGRVSRERHLPDGAEEDAGQIGRVARLVGADGDVHPANVAAWRKACRESGRTIDPQGVRIDPARGDGKTRPVYAVVATVKIKDPEAAREALAGLRCCQFEIGQGGHSSKPRVTLITRRVQPSQERSS